MSLTSNIENVSFASQYPTDKIVGVWSGTFDKASDTITRTGGISSINVFPIAHGFTRPVFVSLLWSDDGTTWVDGGGSLSNNNSSIAFSDSTNIYIAASSATGTQHYRVIAYWIDDYDDTNPLVEGLQDNEKQLNFDSRSNYQKVYAQGEATYDPGTFGSVSVVSITHDLLYKPNAKAFFEPFSGEVWPLNAGGLSNPSLYDFAQDEAYMQIYSDRLDITVSRFSNDTRRVWYRIYFDE